MYNYDSILTRVNNDEVAAKNLSAATLVLCLTALSEMECRKRWRSGVPSVPLTDEQWDIAENWVACSYKDLLTLYAPQEAIMEVDTFTQEQSSGTAGDVYGTAGAVQAVSFNVEHAENKGNVVLVSATSFEALPGLYQVEIDVSTHSCGIGRVGLYEDNGNEHALIGVNHSDETRHANGLVRVPEDNSYYVWFLGSETGNIGRYLTQAGIVERYGRIVWTRLGD